MNAVSRVIKLQQFYRGKHWRNGEEQSDFTITACSDDLSLVEARRLFDQANFGTHQRKNIEWLKAGYGLLKADEENFLFLHVRQGPFPARGYAYPDYRCLVIPQKGIRDLAGNWQPLFRLLDNDEHLPAIAAPPMGRPPVSLPIEPMLIAPMSAEQEHTLLLQIQNFLRLPLTAIAQLLTALITKQRLAIEGAPMESRWDFCQLLALLLPLPYRHELTFATEVFESGTCPAVIKFLYRDPGARPSKEDRLFSWQAKKFVSSLDVHAYAAFVADLWEGDLSRLADLLRSTEVVALLLLLEGGSLTDVLSMLADRLTIGQKIEEQQLTPADEPVVKRLVEVELRLLSQLPDERKDKLQGQIALEVQRLTLQGWGDKVFVLLATWLTDQDSATITRWHGLLWQTALDYLAEIEGKDEASLLKFVELVHQHDKLLPDDFWATWAQKLIAIGDHNEGVTLALLDLSLTGRSASDYRHDLKDVKSKMRYPAQLQTVRRLWFDPNSEQNVERGLLLAASQLVENEQDHFLLDLLEISIDQRAFALIDEDVLHRCQELAKAPGAMQLQLFAIANNLFNSMGELEKGVIVPLAELLVTLKQTGSAVSVLTNWYMRYPMETLLISDFVMAVSKTLVQQQEMLSHLRSSPLNNERTVIFPLQKALLEATPKGTEEMKTLVHQAVEDIWKLSLTWPEKAEYLVKLASGPALIEAVSEEIYQHARAIDDDKQLAAIERALAEHQQLQKKSFARVHAVRMIKNVFGQKGLEDLEKRITIQMLVSLYSLYKYKEEWETSKEEIRTHIKNLSPIEQQNFSSLCLELTVLIEIAPEEKSPYEVVGAIQMKPRDPLKALQLLLQAIERLQPPQKESQESRSWRDLFRRK